MGYTIDDLRTLLNLYDNSNTKVEIGLKSEHNAVSLQVDYSEFKDALNTDLSGDETIILEENPTPLPTNTALLKPALKTTVELDLSDPTAVRKHLTLCLYHMQQLNCKAICKAWIKRLEPRKQARYPYRNGDRSKPPWWPADLRHREPDHLMKEERIEVMLHIVLLPNLISVADLIGATNECLSAIDMYALPFLYEIYFVKNNLSQNLKVIKVSNMNQAKKDRPKVRRKHRRNGFKMLPYSRTKKVRVFKEEKRRGFNDENIFAAAKEDIEKNKRSPLKAKDPNVQIPHNKSSRLETAALEQLQRIYESSEALSPRQVLTAQHVKFRPHEDESLKAQAQQLSPMQLMHKSTPTRNPPLNRRLFTNISPTHGSTNSE